MNIYLIGFMGSGKSHIGRLLAERLGYSFLDLDVEITQDANKSISQIFAEEGEAAFRLQEADALRKTAALSKTVIATGGGCPCFHENMAWINANGCAIFLNPSVDCLLQRLALELAKRPLLANKNEAELREYIRGLMAERLKFYQQAAFIVELEEESEILNAILTFIP